MPAPELWKLARKMNCRATEPRTYCDLSDLLALVEERRSGSWDGQGEPVEFYDFPEERGMTSHAETTPLDLIRFENDRRKGCVRHRRTVARLAMLFDKCGVSHDLRAALIEAAYVACSLIDDVACSGPVTLSFSTQPYVFDFAGMLQRNATTGAERPLQRVLRPQPAEFGASG
eukprot:gene27150-50727_t